MKSAWEEHGMYFLSCFLILSLFIWAAWEHNTRVEAKTTEDLNPPAPTTRMTLEGYAPMIRLYKVDNKEYLLNTEGGIIEHKIEVEKSK